MGRRPGSNPGTPGQRVTLHVRIAPEAEEELAAAALWYETKRPGLGADLLAAVDEALEQISENPLASPIWRQGEPFRRCGVRRFPYVVFFTASEEGMLALAIAHSKRRPGYWAERTARG